MLVKEYRILLPLTVDEYRIAQLYMIQKKSSVETTGADSGVEILQNEPYENGPGGSGQYTYKIYHVGSHLPGWFRAILPKSALRVEEEAWNAYPYTKTRYTCPFVEKFLLEVETRYYNDGGHQTNVFGLSESEMRDRIVDVLDIVKDPISMMDYSKEEDPKLYVSEKTGKGPLHDEWAEECVKTKGKPLPIMCAYKLCKVEFRYWGMQSKIEKFIHDVALRKTMLRAHRQAWAWQDEWYGLTIDDIRVLERKAQEILNQKMAAAREANSIEDDPQIKPRVSVSHGKPLLAEHQVHNSVSPSPSQRSVKTPTGSIDSSRLGTIKDHLSAIKRDSVSDDEEFFDAAEDLNNGEVEIVRPTLVRWSSVEMAIEEEEYNDEDNSSPLFTRDPLIAGSSSSSVTLLLLVFHGGSVLDVPSSSEGHHNQTKNADLSTFKSTLDNVLKTHYPNLSGRIAMRVVPCPPVCSDALSTLARICPYGGVIQENAENNFCCQNLSPALIPLFATASTLYDDTVNTVMLRANQVFNEFLSTEEGASFSGDVCIVGDSVGGLVAYDACVQQRFKSLSRNPSQTSTHSDVTDISMTIKEDEVLDHSSTRNSLPIDTSPARNHLDPNGSHLRTSPNLLHIALERRASSPEGGGNASSSASSSADPTSKRSSSPSKLALSHTMSSDPCRPRHLNAPVSAKRSTSVDPQYGGDRRCRFEFRVSQLFLFGAPLGLVLALRRAYRSAISQEAPCKPACQQIYNLYYATDPCCARLEPLLFQQFARIPPINVPRYQRYPLGDGQSAYIIDCLQRHADEFQSTTPSSQVGTPSSFRYSPKRRFSNLSSSSSTEQEEPSNGVLNVASVISFTSRWWGAKRIDYALYCPEGLSSFPTLSLPSIFHGSYWESSDVAAFIVRQFVLGDTFSDNDKNPLLFSPSKPTERWVRRRTSFKIKNSVANHRGNDVIVAENQPQILHARFTYGPLDVVSLTGEKIDIYIMEKGDSAEWVSYGTDTTDSHGRITFQIPQSKRLSLGVYPIKMVVRGDHTYLDMYLAVVPPRTECVVFSIDGSFTASVSVSGKDPKVRPGAVDVVRHWQDLGYLIIYVTARPGMQQRRVISWLAQHNFPHGMLFFTDGILPTDPLRQKTIYLKRLTQECQLSLQAAYGSSKDISVYKEVGLTNEHIFVIGKVSKKIQNQANVLIDGYSAHLNQLIAGQLVIARAASGNGRMLIRKTCFSLPGQYRNVNVVQRSHSFTPRTGKYESPQTSPGLGLSASAALAMSKLNNSSQPSKLNLTNSQPSSASSSLSSKSRSISPFKFLGRGSKTKHGHGHETV